MHATIKTFIAHAKKLGMKTTHNTQYGEFALAFVMQDANAWRFEFDVHADRADVVQFAWRIGDKHYHLSLTLAQFYRIDAKAINAMVQWNTIDNDNFKRLQAELKQIPVVAKHALKVFLTE